MYFLSNKDSTPLGSLPLKNFDERFGKTEARSQQLQSIIANEKLICSDKLVRRKKLLQQINLPFQIMFFAIEVFN